MRQLKRTSAMTIPMKEEMIVFLFVFFWSTSLLKQALLFLDVAHITHQIEYSYSYFLMFLVFVESVLAPEVLLAYIVVASLDNGVLGVLLNS
jgi:uncharacterized membrane protein YwaF